MSSPSEDIGDKPLGLSLDDATRLDGAAGTYTTVLSQAWEIWGPSGGYLAALALRAAGLSAEISRPAGFYCQFLRSPSFDRVELEVNFLKRSRHSEALSVQMTQHGKGILHALVRTAAHGPGYEHDLASAPDVASPTELRSTEELWSVEQRPPFSFWENVERRPIDQRFAPKSGADERSRPVVREWVRFRPRGCFDDPFVDAARSLILLDTYGWPAAFRKHRDGRFIAPNLDTGAWFHRASLHSQWLLIDHESPIAEHGLLGVNGRVWDLERRLLATGGAQLYCMPSGG
jgi:acyl-CoA thioesterase II